MPEIGSYTLSLGSVDAAIVNPVEVFSFAVSKKSKKVILVHNHSTGDLTPSKQDQDLTKTRIEGEKTLYIYILNHLIISELKWSWAYFAF